jgi:hypothetical protein
LDCSNDEREQPARERHAVGILDATTSALAGVSG